MSNRILLRVLQKSVRINTSASRSKVTRDGTGAIRTTVASPVCATKFPFYRHSNTMASSKEEQRLSLYQDMLRRQVIFKDQFKGAGDDRIKGTKKVDGGRQLEIEWKDGKTSRFHSVWLRHNCHCEECKLSVSGQCLIHYSDLSDDLLVTEVDISEENVLQIVLTSGEKTHRAYLPSSYLKYYAYSGGEMRQKSENARFQFTTDTKIPEIDYKDVIETDVGLYRWLKLLGDQGLCMIKNVPPVEDQVLKVTDRVARIQHTIYGETFSVKDVPKASNAAYRTIGLPLHMDQPTYESPPGIQFLHCIRFDDVIEGGDSVFADIAHIVDVFRQEHPEEFKTLCRVPVTYETIGYGEAGGRDKPAHLQIKRPMVILNNYGDIVSLSYHENLVGPLQVDEDEVEPFYRALRLLSHSVHNWPYKYRTRLQAGDLVTFQNRRLLHGRSEYKSNGGVRQFQGTYINIDEFRSMLIYLNNTLGDGKPIKRMGLIDMY